MGPNIIRPSFSYLVGNENQAPGIVNNNIPIYAPEYQGFDPIANQAMSNHMSRETINHLDMSKLNTNEVYNTSSVGLSMGSLITKDPEKDKVKVDTKEAVENSVSNNIVPNFNSLVKPITPDKIESNFVVQALPVGTERSMLPKPVSLTDQVIANAHLNKSDASQKTSGRKISNWFSRLLEQRGEDYISSGKLSVDEVSKNAERIIDDMISGRVDYNLYGKYIIEPVIIETLISYCSNKLAINKAIQYSLGYTYNDYANKSYITDPERSLALASIDDGLGRDITQSITIVNQDIFIYEILYKKLMYVNSTKNASSLYSLTNDLNNYKKQSKKRY